MLGILKFFRGRKPSKENADKKKEEELINVEEKKKLKKKQVKQDSAKKEKDFEKAGAVKLPPRKIDQELFSDKAIEIAKKEAILTSGRKAYVGDYIDSKEIDDVSAVHTFASNLTAYQDWQWEVVLTKVDADDEIKVLQSCLMPGQKAEIAPKWVPFRDRLKPSDIGETDEMLYEKEDLRLEDNAEIIEILKEEKPEKIENIALSKARVLNAYGKEDLADRWYNGSHGPFTASTRISSLGCNSCAFYISISGDMGQLFGVCANAWSRDDGKVVSLDHGCGMHSETDVTKTQKRWQQGNLVVNDKDQYDLAEDVDEVANKIDDEDIQIVSDVDDSVTDTEQNTIAA